jgi:lipid II:glycine glycyltransferase (peptidoglycan interpeptide bridge formation enzyme)
MATTAARDAFGARPLAYYRDALAAFGSRGHLFLARREGETLAAVMTFHFGDSATYLYGASADRGRRHMPNHRLQWAAMRHARADGRRWYDFWGVPDEIGQAAVAGRDPENVPIGEGGLWGVWGFKRGFGGEVFRTVGAWDEVHAPVRYRLGMLAEHLRRRVAQR